MSAADDAAAADDADGWKLVKRKHGNPSKFSPPQPSPQMTAEEYRKTMVENLGTFGVLADLSDDTIYTKLVDTEFVTFFLSSEKYKQTREWKDECESIAKSELFKGVVEVSSLYETTIEPIKLAKLKIITLFMSMVQRLFPMINKPMVEKLQSLWIANAIGILIECINEYEVQHQVNQDPVFQRHSDGSVSTTFNSIVKIPLDESKSSDPEDLKKREKAARTVAYERFNKFKKNLTSQITKFWLMYVCHTISNSTDPMQSVNNDQWTTIMGTLNESKNKNECMKEALKFMFKIITEMFDTHLTESASKLTPKVSSSILQKAKEKIGMTDVGMVTIDTLEKRRNEMNLGKDAIANFYRAYTQVLGDIAIETTDVVVLSIARRVLKVDPKKSKITFSDSDISNISLFVDSMPFNAMMYACLAYSTSTTAVASDDTATQTPTSVNILNHDIMKYLNDTVETDFYIGECVVSIIWEDVISIYGNLKFALKDKEKERMFCDLRINDKQPQNIRSELERLGMMDDAQKYVDTINGKSHSKDVGKTGGSNISKRVVSHKIKKYTKKWKGHGGTFEWAQIQDILTHLPRMLSYLTDIPNNYHICIAGVVIACVFTMFAKSGVSGVIKIIRNLILLCNVIFLTYIFYTQYYNTSAIQNFSQNALHEASKGAGLLVTGNPNVVDATHMSKTSNIIITTMQSNNITTVAATTSFLTIILEATNNFQTPTPIPMPTYEEYKKGTVEQQKIANAAMEVLSKPIDKILTHLQSSAEVLSRSHHVTPSGIHVDTAQNMVGIQNLKRTVREITNPKYQKLNKMTDTFTKLRIEGKPISPEINNPKKSLESIPSEYLAIYDHRLQGGEIINILLIVLRLNKVAYRSGGTENFNHVEEYSDMFKKYVLNKRSLFLVNHVDSFSPLAASIVENYGGMGEKYEFPFNDALDLLSVSRNLWPSINTLNTNAQQVFYGKEGVNGDIYELVSEYADNIDATDDFRASLLSVFKNPSTNLDTYFRSARELLGIRGENEAIKVAYKNLLYVVTSTAKRFFDGGITKDYKMPIPTSLLPRTLPQLNEAACEAGVHSRDQHVLKLFLNAVLSNRVISSNAKDIVNNAINIMLTQQVESAVGSIAGAVKTASVNTMPKVAVAAGFLDSIAPVMSNIRQLILAKDTKDKAEEAIGELMTLVTHATDFTNFNHEAIAGMCKLKKTTGIIQEFISGKTGRKEFEIQMKKEDPELLNDIDKVVKTIKEQIPIAEAEVMKIMQAEAEAAAKAKAAADPKDAAVTSGSDSATASLGFILDSEYKLIWGVYVLSATLSLHLIYKIAVWSSPSLTSLKNLFTNSSFTFAGLFSKMKTNEKEENTTRPNIEFFGGGNKNKIKTRKIKTNYYSKKTYKRRYNNNKRCIKRRHTKKRNTRK
jgi:hypothetical protein